MHRFNLILCAVLAIGACERQAIAAEATAAEDAIRHSADEFKEAFNHANGEAVAALWTARCSSTSAKTKTNSGRWCG